MLWLPTAQAPAWRRREARAPRLPSREAAAVGGASPRIVLAKASKEGGSRARGWAGVKVRRAAATGRRDRGRRRPRGSWGTGAEGDESERVREIRRRLFYFYIF